MNRLTAILTLLFTAWGQRIALGHDLPRLERSFWLNVSLAAPKLGYWGPQFPATQQPTDDEITKAAGVLCGQTPATRLYLIYHHEMPVADAIAVFGAWRKACPPRVELVPTLLLRMYDQEKTEVFSSAELGALTTFFKKEINAKKIAVYDVLPKRNQGDGLALLSREYPEGIGRIGLQPDEALAPPFTFAVEDTWSGFCHGLTNEDWMAKGFGRDTLKRWVGARNDSPAIIYDLIVVAWDYAHTKRGEYPGYDDANKNLPLPAGRNRLAVGEILATANTGRLAGFSSDLLILELNSESQPHDGKAASFYQTLKRGKPYAGFYQKPWNEVLGIFQSLSQNQSPQPPLKP